MMKAKWIHDCSHCKYTGSMFHHNEILDWYVCSDSIVARRGDDPPDYWSVPICMVSNDHYLKAVDMNCFHAFSDMIVLAKFMLRRT